MIYLPLACGAMFLLFVILPLLVAAWQAHEEIDE